MSEPTKPSSPAGVTVRVADVAEGAPSLPSLQAADVGGALLAGLPTVLFTTIVAAALAFPWAGTFMEPTPWGVTAIFVIIPAFGLAVFVRRWLLTLRRLAGGTGDVRWPFLLVPFFIVVGVACGIAFAVAASHSDEPGGLIVRLHCRDLAAAATGPGAGIDHLAATTSAEDRCAVIGQACAVKLLDEGHDTPEGLRRCIDAGFAMQSDH